MYTIYEMCCDGFDQKLEQQFLKPNRHQKKAYVCSPYSNPDLEVQLDNMRRARLYMLYAYEHMGYLARAPHAYLPMLVCDMVPTERAMALRFGLELLERSDLLLVCGTTLSKGMKGEIAHGIDPFIIDDKRRGAYDVLKDGLRGFSSRAQNGNPPSSTARIENY